MYGLAVIASVATLIICNIDEITMSLQNCDVLKNLNVIFPHEFPISIKREVNNSEIDFLFKYQNRTTTFILTTLQPFCSKLKHCTKKLSMTT